MATNQPVSSRDDLPPHSDNVEEELRRIHLALNAVFSTTSQPPPPPSSSQSSPQDHHQQQQQQQWWQQRQLADRYLTSFQSTAVSWMVCDRLLQEQQQQQQHDSSSNDMITVQQRRFFAAQTLHTKCRSDIHQLPPSSLASLRDSLLAHLQRYSRPSSSSSTSTSSGGSGNTTALTTRLALCVSALAVQMGWTTIVNDLVTNHQQRNYGDPMLLLILFSVLPEECASDRLLLVDENNRFQMRDHLVSTAPTVFDFFQANFMLHKARVLQALHTWIRYVPVHPSALVESPLLQASVQELRQAQYLEPAADVVVEVLRMYPSHQYGNEALIQQMIPLLSQLPLQEALASDNEDVLRAYCRVVTEMGESYMSFILSTQQQQRQEASKLVESVLQCSGGIADSEIASITLHFWYRMVMDLECVEPYRQRQELVDVYTPHLLRLVDVCVSSLMRYPNDIADIAQDRVDDFHKHRYYVSETVEDCCRLLGGQSVLQRMSLLFRNEVERVTNYQQQQQQQQQPTTEWQGIESCLACIGSIHRFVPSDESDLLPLLFQLIPQLPPDVRPLRFTASQMIGKFAPWLAMHSELLQPLLPYLAHGLTVPECAPAAAVSIKELCECSNANFAIAEPVMQLYQDITAHPGRLDLADELQILEGVCRAFSRQIIQDSRATATGTAFLSRLAQPIGNRLAAAVADSSSTTTTTSPRRHIIPEIERLTVIVQFLAAPAAMTTTTTGESSSSTRHHGHGHHPIIELMSSTWPLLDSATNRFPNDNMLAEKICRLHKHALRTAGARAYAPVLDALIQQLVQSFGRTRQSPYLYAASICVTEYGQDPAYSKRLFNMVAAMATTVFSFLRNLDELTNHPDVVEEFFYLMGRMITHCPEPLVTSPLLQSLVQCAIVGMRLDHQGAHRGTLRFLEDTISYGLSLREQNKPECQASLEQVLSQQGQAIVSNLVNAMMGDLPAYNSNNNNNNQIPEILWKLNLLCPGLLAQWLATAFDSANHYSLHIPERAKNDFMGALDTGLARDEFSLAARAFQSACELERRFRKTQRSL